MDIQRNIFRELNISAALLSYQIGFDTIKKVKYTDWSIELYN